MKNTNESRLDSLFQSAINEDTVYSFVETQAVFTSAATTGLTSFATAKLLGSSIFKSKFLIMTITSITLLTCLVLFFNTAAVEARESFTAKGEQSLLKKQLQRTNLQSIPLNSNLDNSPIISELSAKPLILNTLIAKPIPTYHLKPEFKRLLTNSFYKEKNMDTILIIHRITEKTTDDELKKIQEDASLVV